MAVNDGWNYKKDSSPTTGVGKFLKSNTVRSMVSERAELGMALYRERVKKVTGTNAREVRVHTEIDGDRWVAYITAYAPHALAREFGNRRSRNPEHVLRDVARDLDLGF